MTDADEVLTIKATEEEVACDELLRTLARDALEERLQDVVTPMTAEILDPSRGVTPMDKFGGVIVKPELKIVRPEFKFQPSDAPGELSGRFTSRRQQKALALVENEQAQRTRPGRLGGAVTGIGMDPLLELSELGTVEAKALEDATTGSNSDFADLPAFMHLARLEEAVGKGTGLPELPHALAPAGRRAPMIGSTAAVATAVGYGGGTSRVMLSAQGPGRSSRDSSDRGKVTPRVLVASGAWGLQPTAQPGSRRPAANAAALGFSKSALRGTGVAKKGSGAHATALWIGTEVARLREEEATKPRGLGTSHAAAFLVNNGPEQMASISGELTW
eukprot:CAMPEP_0197661744 /NCGR_PEP_ID=MMETSP1338-20131121/51636_1 /TAXON_ID=43686 ORGANISM="Pelagodinium beii, Strain RCC1491" /NCGR_SAMPLE_ID=MMETSP1338 /ASSEMBLY_ACC=CAM_ASM_000754 /LENGTH=331 /DNA_ID=CAMNT_0043239351 /DNA_START=26 /DNA_END=1018 /DNA_ORIENTATION=-